jgi:hypothetical protein
VLKGRGGGRTEFKVKSSSQKILSLFRNKGKSTSVVRPLQDILLINASSVHAFNPLMRPLKSIRQSVRCAHVTTSGPIKFNSAIFIKFEDCCLLGCYNV